MGSPSAAAAGEGWGGSDFGSPLALRVEEAASTAEQAADVGADGAQAEAPRPSPHAPSPAAASPAGGEQRATPPAAETPTKQQPDCQQQQQQQQPSSSAAAPAQPPPAKSGVAERYDSAAAAPAAPPSPPADAGLAMPPAGAADGLAAASSPAPATDGPAAAVSAGASPAASPKRAEQTQASTPARSPTAASPPRAADSADKAVAASEPVPAAADFAAAAAAAAPPVAADRDAGLDEQGLRALVRQLREALSAREQQIERQAQVRGVGDGVREWAAASSVVLEQPGQACRPWLWCLTCRRQCSQCCNLHCQSDTVLHICRPAIVRRRRLPSRPKCWLRCRNGMRSWRPARMGRRWQTCSGEEAACRAGLSGLDSAGQTRHAMLHLAALQQVLPCASWMPPADARLADLHPTLVLALQGV